MSKIDLTPFFMTLSGKKYLQVAGRLMLFREAHPGGGIHTELVTLDLEKGFAQYKAIIIDGAGIILSTAYGSETKTGFPAGWVEKAETVAVGRALAAAGYGTQFALADWVDTHDTKLADAPVGADRQMAESGVTLGKPSAPQIKRLFALVKEAGLDTAWLKGEMAAKGYPAATGDLTLHQYETLVAEVQKKNDLKAMHQKIKAKIAAEGVY